MISNFKHEDNWQDIKDVTMTTIGKTTGKYPDSDWKLKLIRAEHSPIRKLKFSWTWVDIPYYVSTHFVRHKIGIEHWVSTQRSDRTGVDRHTLPQDALVNHSCEADAQALINISRRRLCNGASKDTRKNWLDVKIEVRKVEPELADSMVKECIYRNGYCPEFKSCGYNKTPQFRTELAKYMGYYEDYVYEIPKSIRDNGIETKENVMTKEFIKSCEDVALKYTKRTDNYER